MASGCSVFRNRLSILLQRYYGRSQWLPILVSDGDVQFSWRRRLRQSGARADCRNNAAEQKQSRAAKLGFCEQITILRAGPPNSPYFPAKNIRVFYSDSERSGHIAWSWPCSTRPEIA